MMTLFNPGTSHFLVSFVLGRDDSKKQISLPCDKVGTQCLVIMKMGREQKRGIRVPPSEERKEMVRL